MNNVKSHKGTYNTVSHQNNHNTASYKSQHTSILLKDFMELQAAQHHPTYIIWKWSWLADHLHPSCVTERVNGRGRDTTLSTIIFLTRSMRSCRLIKRSLSRVKAMDIWCLFHLTTRISTFWLQGLSEVLSSSLRNLDEYWRHTRHVPWRQPWHQTDWQLDFHSFSTNLS